MAWQDIVLDLTQVFNGFDAEEQHGQQQSPGEELACLCEILLSHRLVSDHYKVAGNDEHESVHTAQQDVDVGVFRTGRPAA